MVENIVLEVSLVINIVSIIVLFLLLIGAYLIIRNFSMGEICPRCKNTNELVRIKKNKIVNIIPYIKIIRILCGNCHHKHYRVVK